jgi:hypothetical protein
MLLTSPDSPLGRKAVDVIYPDAGYLPGHLEAWSEYDRRPSPFSPEGYEIVDCEESPVVDLLRSSLPEGEAKELLQEQAIQKKLSGLPISL